MSATNVTLDQMFGTIGRLHIQVEALQAEIKKRDEIIANYLKAQESVKAAQAPEPIHHGPFPPIAPSPELVDAVEKTRNSTPDA